MLVYVFFTVLSVLLAILFIPKDWSTKFEYKVAYETPPVILISQQELNLYNGEQGSKGLYLAILGQVFDVEKGFKHYGPGSGYHGMAGKDASLAFITGDFTERGLIDDVSSLLPLQVVALYDWLAFYQKQYQHVGRLIGRFYDANGKPTAALLHVEALHIEGQRLQAQAQTEREHFPPCNSEWSASSPGRVWCSNKSGGVEREWSGVPRKLFSPGSSEPRCVCVEDASTNPNLQEYDDCPPNSYSCHVGQ